MIAVLLISWVALVAISFQASVMALKKAELF
jgi:hypothetical protein